MRSRTPIFITAVSVLIVGVMSAWAGSSDSTVGGPNFDSLKRMVGEWQVNGTEVMRYKITSFDSAIIETLAPGTPNEVVTLYTRDGEDIAVTHFCALGNQPYLLSQLAPAANQLLFEFVRGGNMKSIQEPHFHSLSLTFLDNDHIRQEWQLYENGKPTKTNVLMLTRK